MQVVQSSWGRGAVVRMQLTVSQTGAEGGGVPVLPFKHRPRGGGGGRQPSGSPPKWAVGAVQWHTVDPIMPCLPHRPTHTPTRAPPATAPTRPRPPAHRPPPTRQFSRRPPPTAEISGHPSPSRGVARALLPFALPRESVSAASPPARAGRPRNQKPNQRGSGNHNMSPSQWDGHDPCTPHHIRPFHTTTGPREKKARAHPTGRSRRGGAQCARDRGGFAGSLASSLGPTPTDGLRGRRCGGGCGGCSNGGGAGRRRGSGGGHSHQRAAICVAW